MDFNTIANDAFATGLIIESGMLRSIGTDLWELIKKPFKFNENDKRIINELEKNPNDMKLQGKAEFRLSQLLKENPVIAEELIKCIKKFKEKHQSNEIYNSKNIIVTDNINVNNGDFIVGDGNHYGK